MNLSAQSLFARVSRRELAQNIVVWWFFRGMIASVAALALILSAVRPEFEAARIQLFLAGLVPLGVLLCFTPPRVGTVRNHCVLAGVTVIAALSEWSFQPGGTFAVAIACFIGPLAASRLTDRRHIAGHYLFATVCLFVPVLAGVVDHTTSKVVFAIMPSIWVLGSCCVVILEVAEYQGRQLEQMLRSDPLTGVGNRRLLEERLAEELVHSGRTRRPLSVVAFDLNGFKALNDTVGHAAGDTLLQEVAQILSASVRASDTVVRQGGDEFCILLTGTPAGDAARVAAIIQRRLAEHVGATGVPIATGIGIASYPGDAADGAALLATADARLRADKDSGRHATAA